MIFHFTSPEQPVHLACWVASPESEKAQNKGNAFSNEQMVALFLPIIASNA